MKAKEALEFLSEKFKSIKRFDHSIGGGCECCGSWVEHEKSEDGDWVKYQDIENIFEELEFLILKEVPQMKRYYTNTKEMTLSEIIDKFGDELTEEQINELKRFEKQNNEVEKTQVKDLSVEAETLKEYIEKYLTS